MHVLGIHTQVKDRRALVHFVVLTFDATGWVRHGTFTHSCSRQEALEKQLTDLADALPHLLEGLDLQAVVLRDRDRSRAGMRQDELRVHFTADGVLLAECRRRCAQTLMMDGKTIGKSCGLTKQEAEDAAKAEFGSDYAKAGAAARAAVSLV